MRKQIIIAIQKENRRFDRKIFYIKSSFTINNKKIENNINLGMNTSKNKMH